MNKALKVIKWLGLSIVFLLIIFYVVIYSYFLTTDYALAVKTPSESVYADSKELHQLTLIDDGLASLAKRVELIEQAKTSIELEYFIYELDLSSQIITKKLVEAAGRGVKVRILVDFSAPVFKLKPIYANYVSSDNLEIRYYNTVENARFVSVQHRTHRKLLIIDGEKFLTGGRNMGDDYFNLSHHYNFLDSDMLVEGPIAADVRRSFDFYWNSEFASRPPISQVRVEAKSFIDSEKVDKTLQELEVLRGALDNSNFTTQCRDISFVTDFPGVNSANRQVYRYLVKVLEKAEKEIVGETPYFILRPEGLAVVEGLSRKGIQQSYLTNGLASTDAFYTISGIVPALDGLSQTNVKIYLHRGTAPEKAYKLSQGFSSHWGTHAKRGVVDGRHTLIGTYNVDPRSANLNSEVLIICRDNKELAQRMVSSIRYRMENSWPLFEEGTSATFNLARGASITNQLLYFLALPLADRFIILL